MQDAASQSIAARTHVFGKIPLHKMSGNGHAVLNPPAAMESVVAFRRYDEATTCRTTEVPPRLPDTTGCLQCSSRSLCMPATLSAKDPAGLGSVFGNSRKVRRGEVIYRAGDTFHNLYVARAGSSKTIVIHRDGREQIMGFQITGEFLGMEGLVTGKHAFDAIALEDGLVCVIPFRALETLSHENRDLQRHLNLIMSREIVRESAHMMLIGGMTAEERVAAFLVNLSQRYRDRGYSATQFHLRMTREEIGSYLGLTLETVCRMFSRLQRRGCIAMHGSGGKEVRIVDIDGLARV